jgi:hypothetical protein
VVAMRLMLVRTGMVELPFPWGSEILSPNPGVRIDPDRSLLHRKQTNPLKPKVVESPQIQSYTAE